MKQRKSEPSLLPPSLVLPHSEETERAVLGAVLLQSELLARVHSRLQAEDFFVERHQVIFRAMVDLHAQGTPVDLRTLQARLEQQGAFERAGGMTYLGTLDLDLPDIGRIDAYLDVVVERATRRAVIKLGGEAVQAGLGPVEVEETLARLQGEVPRLLASAVKPRLRSMAEIVPPFLESIEDRGSQTLQGLPTGFDRLDDLTAGLQRGNLIVVAARPGLGKTAFALNVAQNVAIRQGRPVGIWSLEMTEQELALRMLCSEADVPSAMLRKGYLSQAQWGRVVRAGRTLTEAPIYVDDTSDLTVTQLVGRIRRACEDLGLVLAVVDYLQLILVSSRVENRNVAVAQISRALKSLAKSLNIPVVALSQLNRDVTRRSGFRPVLADLRESGAIEGDADLVVFIHREHAYDSSAPPAAAEGIVEKNRHGSTGDFPLLWVGETTTFRNTTATASPAPTSYTEEEPF